MRRERGRKGRAALAEDLEKQAKGTPSPVQFTLYQRHSAQHSVQRSACPGALKLLQTPPDLLLDGRETLVGRLEMGRRRRIGDILGTDAHRAVIHPGQPLRA